MTERSAPGEAGPVVTLRWTPAFRVVPRYPPIEQLEGFDPNLQAAVLAELATVDPGIVGNVELVPAQLPTGPGASRIITSYTFCQPGRFNDETVGAFYAAESLATAVAETAHHILAPLRAANAPPQTLPNRVGLHVDVEARDVVDVRAGADPQLYDPERYGASRAFGRRVHQRGHQGIVYRSVRRAGGECVAIYAPAALSNCREAHDLVYRYAQGRIEVSEVHFTSEL